MKRWPLVALYAGFAAGFAAGCASTDPCAQISGACLGIHVNGPGSVDQLRLILTGAAKLDGRTPSAPGTAEALPIDTAISLPPATSGPVQLTVVGFLAGNNIGRGQITAELMADQHQTLDVTLVKLPSVDAGVDAGVGDLGPTEDQGVNDLKGSDLLDPDLGVRYTFLLPAHNGALGTLAELDTACSSAAAAASLPGPSYRAIIAYRSNDPAAHIVLGTTARPVILPSGKIVAYDNTFFSSSLGHVDNINELASKAVGGGNCAWTNFSRTGMRVNAPSDCNDWQSTDGGTFGSWGDTTDLTHWQFSGATLCTNACHVYCIQQ